MANSAFQKSSIATPVSVALGGTGASTAAGAVTNLGLDNTKIGGFSMKILGGSSVITTGLQYGGRIPYSGTITKWSIISLDGTSGSIVLDVWKDTYANHPPVVGDTITASAKPTVTTATKAESSTLTGWTTSITAGDELYVNVDSVTSLKNVELLLYITKT